MHVHVRDSWSRSGQVKELRRHLDGAKTCEKKREAITPVRRHTSSVEEESERKRRAANFMTGWTDGSIYVRVR